MKKSKLIALALAFLLVMLALITQSVRANPHPFPVMGDMPPDEFTKPPIIKISDVKTTENSVSIKINSGTGESTTADELRLIEISYKSDWNQSTSYLFKQFDSNGKIQDMRWITEFPYQLNLTDIPKGPHTITIFALESGCYYINGYTYTFEINGSSPVNFSIGNSNNETPAPTIQNSTENYVIALIIVLVAVSLTLSLFILNYLKKQKYLKA